jgi:hypothetical protein
MPRRRTPNNGFAQQMLDAMLEKLGNIPLRNSRLNLARTSWALRILR